MTIYLFLTIIVGFSVLVSLALVKRNRRDAITLKNIKNRETEINRELAIHTALEEAGKLPSHHKNHHKHPHQKDKRYHPISFRKILNFILYIVIAIEIIYLYGMMRD